MIVADLLGECARYGRENLGAESESRQDTLIRSPRLVIALLSRPNLGVVLGTNSQKV